MTQEDKQLLLVDLCARLRYGVIIKKKVCHTYQIERLNDIGYGQRTDKIYVNGYPIEQSKPCLRLMSSMSNEEKKEVNTLLDIIKCPSNVTDEIGRIIDYSFKCIELIEFYIKHHFDYHNLIEKGLAIEVPKNMYEITI